MRVRVYQATDGDCLLLETEGADPSRMLVDGGRKTSWREHTAADLVDRPLDLVVVSHIDNDHISGIVDLFDDVVDWRVFGIHEQRLEQERPDLSAEAIEQRERELNRLRPNSPRPPEIAGVWHNALRDQVNHFAETPLAQSQIDDLLATALRMQLLDTRFEDELEDTANIAQGVKEAVILRNRLSADQLDLPVNEPANPETLLYLADESGPGTVPAEEMEVGNFAVRVLGPSRDDLVRLEAEWRRWIAKNQDVAEELRREAQRESERLDAGQPVEFSSVLANLARRLGDGSTITPPNLASLLMMVEADDHSVLLTGDGNASEILRGLRVHDLLPAANGADDASLHVNILKLPHHGATDNIDADGFFSLVTADHYVFCGNGSHHNPEKVVVERLLEVRGGLVDELGAYDLWFSSGSLAANTKSRREHMEMLEELVADVEGCTAHFLQPFEGGEREGRSWFTIEL